MRFPFLIWALPRSRTAWLRFWLSAAGPVGHDLAVHATTVQGWLDSIWLGRLGTVETGAQDAWPIVRRAMPTAPFATIRRPVNDVIASLRARGVIRDEFLLGLVDEMERRAAVLDEIEAAGALRVEYADLADEDTCRRLFEHLTGMPFNASAWAAAAEQNVQIDLPVQIGRVHARREELIALKAELAASVVDMPDFVRVGPEPWGPFWREAKPLAIAHHIEAHAGSIPGRPFNIDEPQMEMLAAAGVLHVFSARLNGRLIGYILWTVGMDAESQGVKVGYQGPWYVERGHPGIGKRLLDFSVGAMRAVGCGAAELHHNLHGRGRGLERTFTRMGAVPLQARYSLDLRQELGRG